MIYLNYDIFNTSPLLDPQSHSIDNNFFLVGKEAKKQEKFSYEAPFRTFSWTYHLKDLNTAREIRAFFRKNYGRYGSFWLPSFKNDFEFLDYDNQNLNAFKCKAANRGVTTFNIKRHIYIPSQNYASKITLVTEDNGVETISLSSQIPNGIDSNTKIMNLFFVRFASDEFKLENNQTSFKTTLGFVELQGESW
jgi:hypothetical protein